MKQQSQWMKLSMLSLALVFLAGCGAAVEAPEAPDLSPFIEEDMTETDMQELEEAAVMPVSDMARYRIEFVANWSEETHPEQYESSAHFSPFIAYTYDGSEEGRIWTASEVASEGMKVMAETGKPVPLESEIDVKIEAGVAHSRTRGNRIDSPGFDEGTIDVAQSHPELGFVSMLAPSPDWFVFGNTVLFDGDMWVPRVVVDLTTYDAGTASGATLTADDIETDPRALITTFDESLQGLGQVVLTRVE